MYGRGTSDDKGPAVAALYAMKAVRDLGFELDKDVRLILGSVEVLILPTILERILMHR
mgnify:CR=1 FL=1